MAFETDEQSEASTSGDIRIPALVSLATLLDEKAPAALNRFRSGVRKMPTETLVNQLRWAYRDGKRVGAYLLNEELTRRGFPPCFRHLPDPTIGTLAERFDIFMADAQWIATRYPEQKPMFSRYGRLFLPSAFHATAQFIFYFGKTPAWKIVKGLALTEDQQWECHWLQSGPLATKRRFVQGRLPIVREELWQALFHGRRGGQTEKECIATIQRRRALWLCNAMANRRPQRTADLFEMMTGEKIGRNVVAKQLEKIRRDVR